MRRRACVYALLLALIAATAAPAAVKPRYGGEVSIRLNEPIDFSPTTANYSNLVFYSLIFENFFYLRADGTVYSNIFSSAVYQPSDRTFTLTVKKKLSYSNGKPLGAENIRHSLKYFLGQDLLAASRLNKLIKEIRVVENRVVVELLNDFPAIPQLFLAPELVVISESEQSFSGPFQPAEWSKGRQLVLKANPFYPGGRTYLDSVRVVFTDEVMPDIYLGAPGRPQSGYKEYNSGVYQNIYLCFPQPGTRQNVEVALYSFLKQFNERLNLPFKDLNSLISDAESPVTVSIKTMPAAKMLSLLHYGDIRLYAQSSLKEFETAFADFLRVHQVRMELIFIDNTQVLNFMKNSEVRYMMIEKIFQKKTPAAEKVARILRETTFTQFNEKYLRLLNELEEVDKSGNNELMMEQTARTITAIVNDGFILPLFQKNFSLYIKEKLLQPEIDYYGRPLLQRALLGHE